MKPDPPDPNGDANHSSLIVKHEELVARAKFYSGKILDGELTPYDGATLIWKECHLKSFHGDHTFDPFVYWQDEYEDAQSEERRLYCADVIRQFARELLGGPPVVLDPAELLPSIHPSRPLLHRLRFGSRFFDGFGFGSVTPVAAARKAS